MVCSTNRGLEIHRYHRASKGALRVTTSTAPDLSGSGRVDMLTRPVPLERAADVATGASG